MSSGRKAGQDGLTLGAFSQDLPPKGGFAPVQYKRNLPQKGPRAAWLLLGATAVSFYGWYKYALANAEQRELQREKVWARLNLVPMLDAEHDRDLVRRRLASEAQEAEAMKDVPGWQAGKSPYKTPLGKAYPPVLYPAADK